MFCCSEEDNFRTRTPKGDGNVRVHHEVHIERLISEHEPRKGTETPRALRLKDYYAGKFQNTNPERGRKPS